MLHHFFVGCTEEAAFRYIAYDCILKRLMFLPTWLAILISSIGFGLMHLMNAPIPAMMIFTVPQVVMAAVLGVLLAHGYIKKGLWLPILVHATYNILTSTPTIVQAIVFFLGVWILSVLPVYFYHVKKRTNQYIQKAV